MSAKGYTSAHGDASGTSYLQSEPMTFEEALTRARAAHVKVATFYQPGNDYAEEHRCSQGCGLFGSVFESRWEQHIIDAADELRAKHTSGEGFTSSS